MTATRACTFEEVESRKLGIGLHSSTAFAMSLVGFDWSPGLAGRYSISQYTIYQLEEMADSMYPSRYRDRYNDAK